MNCKICDKEISQARLKILPETNICAQCIKDDQEVVPIKLTSVIIESRKPEVKPYRRLSLGARRMMKKPVINWRKSKAGNQYFRFGNYNIVVYKAKSEGVFKYMFVDIKTNKSTFFQKSFVNIIDAKKDAITAATQPKQRG